MKINNSKLHLDYIKFRQNIEQKTGRTVSNRRLYTIAGVSKRLMHRVFVKQENISMRSLEKICNFIKKNPKDYLL